VSKLHRGDLVFVAVDDIEHIDHGWEAIETLVATKPGRFMAVGWVIGLSKRFVVVAPFTQPSEHQAHCAYRLPRGGIRKVWRIVP